MKKRIVLILIIGLAFISCTSVPFEFTTQGYAVNQNTDTERMEKSIKKALLKFNWVVYEEVPGSMKAQYSKSNGLITAEIQILYSANTYSLNYLGSKNLDENLRRMTIHKNYNRWIANLNKTIYEYYLMGE